ncbi:hypothetical protein CMV_027280 [Castanea mollissima]|uniref:Uncharacterized protein n=1 Tax=Castanea mollissima TaxID=60419 RepID=A0A8J4Q6S4_9ROSI|nr:hypothetical protein CMV_027280 [Castanea mollissima]
MVLSSSQIHQVGTITSKSCIYSHFSLSKPLIRVGRWQRQLEGIGENGGHWQNLRHRFRGHSLADPDELCDPVI